ncbi:hypothetical protein [Pseudomonas sp. R76]|uniref:hypothetical protein n=1 Tax=Pseudomonas sp. R76 TaxID=1573711 RepID=UPI00131FCC9B|nr:hypothetical protein [Pseudomonas sp. R76]QHD05556.1 hypothetical protein PspR76_07345 [Pseudomonas sp. R76]
MSYGLTVINDSSVVSIDSEYARLCVFHKGTYTANVGITFQNVVTTQEPPLVFIRPQNNGAFIQLGLTLGGSAGAWAGATVVSGQAHSGEIFVAAFSSKPITSYGLRMWDADSKQIFDSGTQAVIFTRAVQNWSYTHTTYSSQGLPTNWYAITLNYALGDYLMINNARMPMMGANNETRSGGLRYDFASSVLRFSVTTVSNPFYFSLQAIFGKIAV